MLLPLNDDCLRVILRMLSFEDQISCTFLCKRLKIVAIEIWNPEKQLQIRMKDFKNITLKNFVQYLKCISKNVEELRLEEVDLNSLKGVKFLNVHTLKYVHFNAHGLNSENLIGHRFPKLANLTVKGSIIRNKYLNDLRNLETLELNLRKSLYQKDFININFKLTKLKKLTVNSHEYTIYEHRYCKTPNIYAILPLFLCETLRELFISEDLFYCLSKKFDMCKNLKKFVCFDLGITNRILKEISKRFGNIVETMKIDGVLMCPGGKLPTCMENLIALRKLILNNVKFQGQQLRVISESVNPLLEEFHYRNGCISGRYYIDVLNTLYRCKKLKIFDLSNTEIDVEFVKEVAETVKLDNEERDQILVMNCSRTKVKIDDLKNLQLPEKLQISFEYKELEIQPEGSILCELNTTDENN